MVAHHQYMDIYQALSDPKRRRLIELLGSLDAAKNGLSIKQLSQGSGISRQAITKHLNILIKVGLVKAEFVGKERRHFLQPGKLNEPIEWLQPLAEVWDKRLKALKQHLK